MTGTDVENKHLAVKPLTINLPDRKQIQSTHVCDIQIPGLPTVSTGHIVPSLTIASLIGIRPLCKAGCKVIFDNKKCNMLFKGVVILRGFKDPGTNLWTLLIPTKVCTALGPTILPCPGPCEGRAPQLPMDASDTHPDVTMAMFMHSVQTWANAVNFAHQSLCNPKISTLLKAICRGFLKGCPNLLEMLGLKYLNPSSATAKGHMKHPCHGIKSTQPKKGGGVVVLPEPIPQIVPPVLPLVKPNILPAFPSPAYCTRQVPDVIADDGDDSVANIFCFGAFADRHSGIVYHYLTGSFPFMSFDSSVCFLILFHYESNAILATPLAGLGNISIFNAYKRYFKDLSAKGFKPKLNVMDNQATKHIKQFLTEKDCKLQVVKPHNHQVNAAKRMIQTFKVVFIAALTTTDSDFTLQFWDRLTPQVEITVNMLRAS